MEKNTFKIIEGGVKEEKPKESLEFMCAYVTDTRLMGVLYLYVRWLKKNDEYLNMFFYLDAEETGFETYRSYHGNDLGRILDIEDEMSGGLGGKLVELSLKEAKALLGEYAAFNKEHGLKLPSGYDEYEIMLEPVSLKEKEKKQLLKKQCTEITSEYELIHYFLMRCFGHDFEMAEKLADENVILEIYEEYEKASYYRNEITKSGEGTYYCNSLIESGNTYYLLVSEIAVRDKKVIFFENCSKLEISHFEAAMILSRSEFINCYEILTDPDTFDILIKTVAEKAVLTKHENGNMYMLFYENNKHVAKPVFQMNEDVFGMFYVTKYGQLIVCSYLEENIDILDDRLSKHEISEAIVISSRYEFKDPVLYDFVTSGFDDFDGFVDFLNGE